MIKAKIKAAAVHGLLTLLVAIVTASVIFGVWFPGEMATMLDGTKLFLLVLGVELAMGPLMSLVIYSPLKPSSELVRDYSIVGVVQVTALLYGLCVVAASRPAYIVFVKDRLEVVTATELEKADLMAGPSEFQTLPLLGPKLVCTESPSNPQEKSDLLISGLAGKDIQLFPKYYRHCIDGEISSRAMSKSALVELMRHRGDTYPQELEGVDFTWLPAVTRFGAWVVIFSNGEINQREYVDIDPFEM